MDCQKLHLKYEALVKRVIKDLFSLMWPKKCLTIKSVKANKPWRKLVLFWKLEFMNGDCVWTGESANNKVTLWNLEVKTWAHILSLFQYPLYPLKRSWKHEVIQTTEISHIRPETSGIKSGETLSSSWTTSFLVTTSLSLRACKHPH